MHNWQCCCLPVRCCVLWYWLLRGKFNAALLYSYSHLIGHVRNKGRTWIGHTSIKLYIWNDILGDCKRVSTFRRTFQFPVWRRILKKFRKSHGTSLYEVAGFKHTAVEPACINKDKDRCILELHPQSPRHCKSQPSELDSKILRQFFLSHVISNYCLSRRIQATIVYTRQQKHADLCAHNFKHSHFIYHKLKLTNFTWTWRWRVCGINPDVVALKLCAFRRKI